MITLDDLHLCAAMRRSIDGDRDFMIRMQTSGLPVPRTLKQDIAARKAAYSAHVHAVENIIGQLLDGRHLRIMRLYFIEGKTMTETATASGHSRARCHELLHEALELVL